MNLHRHQHHPDYARIAELEREIGIGEPVAEPLPEYVIREALRPVAPAPARAVPKPDNVCAFCIQGKTPAHGCPFWPGCQE